MSSSIRECDNQELRVCDADDPESLVFLCATKPCSILTLVLLLIAVGFYCADSLPHINTLPGCTFGLFGWWLLANYILWIMYAVTFVLHAFNVVVLITVKSLVVGLTGMAVTGTIVVWPDAICLNMSGPWGGMYGITWLGAAVFLLVFYWLAPVCYSMFWLAIQLKARYEIGVAPPTGQPNWWEFDPTADPSAPLLGEQDAQDAQDDEDSPSRDHDGHSQFEDSQGAAVQSDLVYDDSLMTEDCPDGGLEEPRWIANSLAGGAGTVA